MKVLIGTNNKMKISVVEKVFMEIFQINSVEVASHAADSLVPETPRDKETYLGAYNRAIACQKIGSADYYVGLESGLIDRYGMSFEEAWAVVIDKDGRHLVGYSSGLMLPGIVTNRMENGELHHDIMENLDKLLNLPTDNRDTWSRYTGGNISRDTSLMESLRNALLQAAPSDNNLYSA